MEFRDDIDDVSPGNIQVRDVHWTDANGNRIGDYIGPPEGANDIHVRLPKGGRFTKGRWSVDHRPWPDQWDPPRDADDFHLRPDSSGSFAIHFPKELLLRSPGILSAALAVSDISFSGQSSNREPREPAQKVRTIIRSMLGVSFFTGSEKNLRVAVVLPGSPAEAAGIRSDDTLTQIGDMAISKFCDARDAVAKLSSPVTLPATLRREGKEFKIKVTPGFYIFPYQSFSSGVKFNKFCDRNCDCTIAQSGIMCVTVYIYVGEGSNGGMLLQKVCSSQESGLPQLHSICDIGEYT